MGKNMGRSQEHWTKVFFTSRVTEWMDELMAHDAATLRDLSSSVCFAMLGCGAVLSALCFSACCLSPGRDQSGGDELRSRLLHRIIRHGKSCLS